MVNTPFYLTVVLAAADGGHDVNTCSCAQGIRRIWGGIFSTRVRSQWRPTIFHALFIHNKAHCDCGIAALLWPILPFLQFARYFRTPDHALKHDDNALGAINTKMQSRPDARPKTAMTFMGRRSIRQDTDKPRKCLHSSVSGKQQLQQQQQQTRIRQHSHAVAAHGTRSPHASGKSSKRSPGSARHTRAGSSMEAMQPLPQLRRDEEEKAVPAGTTIYDTDTRQSVASITEQTNNAERTGDKHHRRGGTPPVIQEATDTILPKRPSTAPSTVCAPTEPFLHAADECKIRVERRVEDSTARPTASERAAHSTDARAIDVERGIEESTTKSAAREESELARQLNTGKNSHQRASPAEVSNAHNANGQKCGRFKYVSGPQKCDTPEVTRPVNTFALTATEGDSFYLATTKEVDTDLSLVSMVSLRPATAEALRRPSIEAVAALSRSSRLPPPSCSVSLGSASGLSTFNGTMTGGGSRDNNLDNGGPRVTRGSADLQYAGKSNASVESGVAAGVGTSNRVGASTYSATTRSIGQSRRYSSHGEGGGGGSSSSKHRDKTYLKRRRPRRQQVARGDTGLNNQQREQERSSSAPGRSRAHLAGGKAAEDGFYSSPTSASAALALAVGTAWTHWRRPGDLGELDVQADPTHGRRRKAAAAAACSRNGAVTGAGWGGNDQVLWYCCRN